MSLTSVDLPEPHTPVTQVSRPSGNSAVDVLQIVAPGAAALEHALRIGPVALLRDVDAPSCRSDTCPVSDSGCAAAPPRPCPARRSPRRARPRRGPGPPHNRPRGWCPRRARRRCTVLPRSRRLRASRAGAVVALMQADARLVEDVQDADAGPSRSALASRMRCASPPDSVSALRSSVRYPRPTFARKPSRRAISLTILRRSRRATPGASAREKLERLLHRQRGKLGQAPAEHEHVARRAVQA